jgi:hypothetical protein
MLPLAQLLRNWREQRPSNQDDFNSSVTGEVGRVYSTGVDLFLISFFVSWYVTVLGLRFKNTL